MSSERRGGEGVGKTLLAYKMCFVIKVKRRAPKHHIAPPLSLSSPRYLPLSLPLSLPLPLVPLYLSLARLPARFITLDDMANGDGPQMP